MLLPQTQDLARMQPQRMMRFLPGLGVCILLALIAWHLGRYLPVVGAPIAGLLIGMVLGNSIKITPVLQQGIDFSAKHLLPWAIIGLGLQLDIQQVWQVGSQSLAIIVFSLLLVFALGYIAGRVLKLPLPLTLLITCGTGICGGSAIAAVAPILMVKERDVGLALSTIFLFNVIAVFLFPVLGHSLGMSDSGFGIWAGTAINDTSAVVAAAYSYSMEAGDIATIVKLSRASFILPICLLLAFLYRHKNSAGQTAGRVFPWFILGFVLAVCLHSLHILPEIIEQALIQLAYFLLIMALVAVGLNSQYSVLLRAGKKPLLLGLFLWSALAGAGLFIQYVQGQW